ncbi:MAG TPA: cyclopropane-fatty-acyl-phospholipid synthase family protein [Bauldia sp.]|nr:cyclopropane-fatty-acyl-phospholipid synthase family protein [Bauldia sp.]
MDQASQPPSTNGDRQPGASRAAIQAHYDLSEDFFRLWLGPELVYSAALFEGDEDLAAAQMRKLDHHIGAARARGAGRVLDIGCGWGALLRRLVQSAGVREATGLTLSASQARWIRDAAVPGVTVREESWREHRPTAPYDAIISIGAFEHFARPGLSAHEKLAAYREFFAFCRDALKENGRLSLQTIAYVGSHAQLPPFIAEEVFRESELPLIAEPLIAAADAFEVVALRNDREHYDRTLRMWERALATHEREAVALVGADAVAHFHRYLKISAMGFRTRAICLLRMSFVRRP